MENSVIIDAGSSLDINSGHVYAPVKPLISRVWLDLINGGLFDFCDVGVFESGDLIFRDGFELLDWGGIFLKHMVWSYFIFI